eukprot:TRINITY_DN1229_c0_g1_i2.p1 TRINITY_DN1229_c0_g1~~TRINITY_DN1229_c0_g1_i2.p1  ORF type:complete len:925 (+),score=142.08 TRINITY_DN1229_c0_g1_i2:65-2776(+)
MTAATAAVHEIKEQLEQQGGTGNVWVEDWNDRFGAELGPLRDFIESCAEFTIIPAPQGRKFVVQLAEGGEGKGSKGQLYPRLINRGPTKGSGRAMPIQLNSKGPTKGSGRVVPSQSNSKGPTKGSGPAIPSMSNGGKSGNNGSIVVRAGGKRGGKGSLAFASQCSSPEEVANQVHSALHEALSEAVQPIAELEETWSPEELRKRIVRYIYKGFAAEELTALPWSQAVRQFVEKATQTYTSVCSDKPWFHELDITPALVSAALCLACACEGGSIRPQPQQVEGVVTEWHHLLLSKTRVDKVLWETIQTVFPVEEKSQTKLQNALSKSYGPAYEAARLKGRSAKDFRYAERFVKAWVHDGISRAWNGVADNEQVLNESTVVEFFQTLVAPYDSSDSCLPAPLVAGLERSPEEWGAFLHETVRAWYEECANPPSPGTKKKRKKKAKSDLDANSESELEQFAGAADSHLFGSGVVVPPPSKRARGNGPSFAQREVVDQTRYRGTLVEWRGRFGWIEPIDHVNHPANRRGGRIYLAQDDVVEDIDDGSTLSFLVYADSQGLGAYDVRVARSAAAGMRKPVPSSAPLKGGGKGQFAAARSAPSPDEVANQVHSALTEAIREAVEPVAHLEESWSPQELGKRIVRYLYKGFKAEDFTSLSWSEAVRKFVQKSTIDYTRVCSDKPWFQELDVAPALASASWCLASACKGWPRPPQLQEVHDAATEWHQVALNKLQVDKVLWETIQSIFPLEEKSQTKLWNGLSKSYEPAYEAARLKGGEEGVLERAERFVHEWVFESLGRAWNGVKDADEVLNENALVEFFQCLVAPHDLSFSCMPLPLVVERSSDEWTSFLHQSVQAWFQKFQNPAPPTGKKKRGKASKDDVDMEAQPQADAYEQDDQWDALGDESVSVV